MRYGLIADKLIHPRGKLVGVLLALFVASAIAPVSARAISSNEVRLVVEAGCAIGRSSFSGNVFADEQIVSRGPTAVGTFAGFEFPGDDRVGIDALIVVSNAIIFSTDVDFTVGTNTFADEDLVQFHGVSGELTKYIDGSYHGIPEWADIDAACFGTAPNSFLLSLDTWFASAEDHDILELRPGFHFIRKYRGSQEMGIPERADIDALYHDGQFLYFSLDTTETIASLTARDEDIWIFDEWAMQVVGVISGIGIEPAGDLAGLDDLLDSDGDWLSDFEERTGRDEAGTTLPGSELPLSPNGYGSDPTRPDTDGDGLTDGKEAAAGTDPRNQWDCLKITAIDEETGGQVVTWASVPGKHYDLYGGGSASNIAVKVRGDLPASAGAATSYTNNGAPRPYFYRVHLGL